MEDKLLWIALIAIALFGLMAIVALIILLSNRDLEEQEETPRLQWEVELWNISHGYQVAFQFTNVCVLGRLTLRQNAVGTIPPLMDRTISREHCMLIDQDGLLMVWNMSAVNPTRLNGYPLNEPGTIIPGDRIELGDSAFLITRVACGESEE